MLSAYLNNLALALVAIVSIAPTAIALITLPVNLRTAANYAVLAKSGVSTISPSSVTGAVAVSPVAAVGLTGFSQTLDLTGTFSTSSQVVGQLFAASYAAPTPSNLAVAIVDMQTAFNDANGRILPDFTNLGGGAIGGLVLLPGLYKWSGAVNALTDFTIAGTAADTWIFQVGSGFTIAAAKKAILVGALSRNIVWVVTGTVTAGAGSHLEGVFLTKTSVSLVTGASLNGRILSQTSVALQKATVVSPVVL